MLEKFTKKVHDEAKIKFRSSLLKSVSIISIQEMDYGSICMSYMENTIYTKAIFQSRFTANGDYILEETLKNMYR